MFLLRLVRRASAPVLVGSAVLMVYLTSTARADVSIDVFATDAAAWTIGSTGSPWVDLDDLPGLAAHPGRDVVLTEDESGHEVIERFPGGVMAAIPAYAVSTFLGTSVFSFVPGAVTAALLVALAVALVTGALTRTMSRGWAICSGLVLGLSTPLWTVAADNMWPHTVTVVGIAGMAWASSRERWWLVGILGGVALWGRLPVAVIVAVVGLFLGRTRGPQVTMSVAVPSLGLLLLQCAWTQWVYGSWSPLSTYDNSVDDFTAQHLGVVNHLGFWFSLDRGFLVVTPTAVVLLPIVARQWRTLPDWMRALPLGGLAYTLLQGFLAPFHGGDSFDGYRLMLEFLVCVAPACAHVASRASVAVRLVLCSLVAVQLLMTAPVAFAPVWLPATEAWTSNYFAHAVGSPLVAALLLVGAAAAGLLAGRIWASPAQRAEQGQG